MKWFTMEWWAGESQHDAAQLYQEHIRSIRDRLPPELLALTEKSVLHDGNVKALSVSDGNAVLRLRVYGEGGGRTLVELRYAGVASFESSADAERALAGPGGFGDLGYDEVDLDAQGLFVHRLLFSSSIQIEVRFRKFSLVQLLEEQPA